MWFHAGRRELSVLNFVKVIGVFTGKKLGRGELNRSVNFKIHTIAELGRNFI